MPFAWPVPSKKFVMIEGLFNQTNYVATKKMMDATTLRQEALASNIANVETPGYQRMDVADSFKNQFSKAISEGGKEAFNNLNASLEVDSTAIARDETGNTVDLESEVLQLGENQIAHQLESKIITGSLAKLRLAITGRP
jgi:flagellar basal-body rod protein FlgB